MSEWDQFPAYANIDRRRGAPAAVRAAVGAAQTPEDRLATLRRFAPDARPFGTDNFLFTDRRTGRPTIYNPQGFDFGDMASIIPEAGEFLGGAVGGALAAAPAIAGAVPTGGASVLAVPAGVGLGAAAGREIATLGASLLGPTVDSRGPVERVTDAAGTAAVNAAAVPVGDLVARGARAMFGPVARAFGGRTGTAALDDFANARVTPSAGAVTGNRSVQLLERGLETTPGGVEPVRALAERQAAEMGDEAARIARAYGTPRSPTGAGATIREGADAAVARFNERQEALYGQAFGLIGADSRMAFPAVQRLQGELGRMAAEAPRSRGGMLDPVIGRVQGILDDAADAGGMRFETMRQLRTDIGRELGAPGGSASPAENARRQYLERLYGALTEDMAAHARSVSPEADRALRVADRYTRFNATQNLPALAQVQRQRTDEDIYLRLFPESGRPDVQEIARIRRNMRPEEWNEVAASVIQRLGMPRAGQNAGEDFSVSTFLTRWNQMNERGAGAAQVLFGGAGQNAQLANELERLARVAGRLRDVERMANPSGTARNLITGAGMLASGQQAVEGDWRNAASIAALGTIAPRLAARAITNPQFVRWLAGATPALQAGGAAQTRALARLGAVAEANPELQEAVDAFRAVFVSPAPAPTAR